MAQISSGIGLISGINSADIINQLMSIEAQPVTNLQARINTLAQTKTAYQTIATGLTSLQTNAQALNTASTFQAADATSSDDSVVSATAATGATQGSYQLQVAQLVTTQQVISQGYEDFNNTKVGAGTITIGLGGGELTKDDQLADLNGGAGVSSGQFRITDRSGASTVIDTSSAVTLQDVVKKINTALDVQVHASLQGDKIVLDDTTGKTASNLIVQDIGDGTTAKDLGIVGSVAGDELTGSNVNYISRTTSLNRLNDGLGVSNADGAPDFSIQPSSGAAINVSIATATDVGDVIDAINTAGHGRIKADISADGKGLSIVDTSGGGGAITVTALNGSTAAKDLGIQTTDPSGTITGNDLLGGLGTVLVSSLNGGAGLNLGTIAIKDRASSSSINVDLSGAKSVQDILDTINNSGASVQASLTDAGDAIQIQDTSGGTGDLQIDDTAGGHTAQDLGIAGDFDASVTAVKGIDLHRQYVSATTLLSNYNGGKGVAPGSIQITNSKGASASISINSNQVSIGDVIQQINQRDIGVTASINKNGNGILLTDTAGGGAIMKVSDVDSTTAKDLNIAGTATGTTIDGAEEKTIDVTANDTLATLQTKINNLGFGVSASIINDGTGNAPYRLSLTANSSGLDGRVIIDTGTTSLDSQTLVKAQNAAVFLGGIGSAQPLLLSSSSNQITGAIKGVTLTLNGVSDAPVNIAVTQSADNAVSQINSFVQGFNSLVDGISSVTGYDSDTQTAGLLLGDSTVQTIQADLYDGLNGVVANNGKYRLLSDVGITITDGAKLSFDEDKFRAAFADDPAAVQNLFTEIQTTVDPTTGKSTNTDVGLGGIINNQINKLIDPVSGVITQENATLDAQTQEFNDRISDLNDLLDQKRSRLEEQFANLESVLAGLQSQQQALGSITTIKAPTTTSSSSK
jgi:flagellar hook-associated protein 2